MTGKRLTRQNSSVEAGIEKPDSHQSDGEREKVSSYLPP